MNVINLQLSATAIKRMTFMLLYHRQFGISLIGTHGGNFAPCVLDAIGFECVRVFAIGREERMRLWYKQQRFIERLWKKVQQRFYRRLRTKGVFILNINVRQQC